MAARLSRRDLMFSLRAPAQQVRPPWSVSDDIFTEHCSSCGACIKACAAGLIVAGRANYPIVDFAQGECTFCGACADACPEPGCFDSARAMPAWRVRAEIKPETCVETRGVSCRMCEDVCSAAAIAFKPSGGGRRQAQVLDDICSGCGACRVVCPVGAIGMFESAGGAPQ